MEKEFWFYSPLTERSYTVTSRSIWDGTRFSGTEVSRDEAKTILSHFIAEEWVEINAISAAIWKSWTFGAGHKKLSEDELQIGATFGVSSGTLYGSQPLAPFLSMACALHTKKEELLKKLKTAIRHGHPMVVMAEKMAGHLSHGWTGRDGENLVEIEEGMARYEEGHENDPFGAGLRPPLYFRGVKDEYPFVHDAEIAMSSTSGTGRYSWEVNWQGALSCDICRPGGTAIHIVIKQVDGGVVVDVKKGDVEFEDRHLEHVEGVIEACAGTKYVKPAMTQSLLSSEEFDTWQERKLLSE